MILSKIYVMLSMFLVGMLSGILITLGNDMSLSMRQIGVQIEKALHFHKNTPPHQFFLSHTNLCVTVRADGSGVIKVVRRN